MEVLFHHQINGGCLTTLHTNTAVRRGVEGGVGGGWDGGRCRVGVGQRWARGLNDRV